MQKIKKIFINLIALVVGAICCLSLVACGEDIKKLNLNLEVYDYAENGTTKEYALTIDLYRHLAPVTVDAIVKYVNDGYYNNTAFYKFDDYDKQIMIGDYVVSDGNYPVKNSVKPFIEGEFEYGGTKGSDLLNKKGSIGLWRSWYESDGSYTTTSDAMKTGSSTLFMPTETISNYDKYFCVFGKFDAENENNKKVVEALNKAFGDSNYISYEIYYTGTYDETKEDNDFGLTWHIVEAKDFDASTEGLFTAEGMQLDKYNHHTIKIPYANGKVSAKIVSAKIG